MASCQAGQHEAGRLLLDGAPHLGQRVHRPPVVADARDEPPLPQPRRDPLGGLAVGGEGFFDEEGDVMFDQGLFNVAVGVGRDNDPGGVEGFVLE